MNDTDLIEDLRAQFDAEAAAVRVPAGLVTGYRPRAGLPTGVLAAGASGAVLAAAATLAVTGSGHPPAAPSGPAAALTTRPVSVSSSVAASTASPGGAPVVACVVLGTDQPPLLTGDQICLSGRTARGTVIVRVERHGRVLRQREFDAHTLSQRGDASVGGLVVAIGPGFVDRVLRLMGY